MPKLVDTNYTPTLLSSKKTGTDRDYMWVRKKLMAAELTIKRFTICLKHSSSYYRRAHDNQVCNKLPSLKMKRKNM